MAGQSSVNCVSERELKSDSRGKEKENHRDTCACLKMLDVALYAYFRNK